MTEISMALPIGAGAPGSSPKSLAPRYVRLGQRRAGSSSDQAAQLRLVLLGFAGGTITSLLSLASAFPPSVQVWGAEYPGRGMRWQSPLIECIDPLLDDLLPGLSQLSDRPVALLGFSMGAHVAYRLALRAATSCGSSSAPIGLVAVSARPPRRQASDWPADRLTDAQLIERLRSLGGIPADILESRVLMESFLPVARADLDLCADMNRFPPERLPCPVLALQGDRDPLLMNAEVPAWLELSGGSAGQSMHHAYAGGHFFHKGIEGQVAQRIAAWLHTLQATPTERCEHAPGPA